MSNDTIIFSDAHVGYNGCNITALGKFAKTLKKDPPVRLVIAGDLLDLWRRGNAEIIVEHADLLNDLFSLGCPTNYVVGNHDFAIRDIAMRTGKEYIDWPSELTFSRDLRLGCGNTSAYICHGDVLDVAVTMEGMDIRTYEAFSAAMCKADDTVGGIASIFWAGVTKASPSNWGIFARHKIPSHSDKEFEQIARVANSGSVHLLTGAHPQDLFIFGHTHWPYISKNKRVVNTGSWCTEDGIAQHNTYAVINEKGELSLKQFVG